MREMLPSALGSRPSADTSGWSVTRRARVEAFSGSVAESRGPRAESHLLALLAALPLVVATACTPASSSTLAGAPFPVASDSIETRWARGSVRTDSFAVPSLGVTKRYLVYLPPSYASAPRRRYAVAYYLHGLYGDETNWARLGRLDRAMDSLVAIGVREMIVVMPDGDDSWYTTWETPRAFDECVRTTRREAAERYCTRSQRYDEYIARDLVRHVDSTWRTRPDVRHRAVAGLSMGGMGAVNLAVTYRDTYSAAASHSGVLAPLFIGPKPFAEPPHHASDMRELEAAWSASLFGTILPAFGVELDGWRRRDPVSLVREAKSAGRPLPALRVDVGRDDGLVVNGNRAFRWELERAGVPLEYHEHPGAHSWEYWRSHVGESLRWLAERVAVR